MEPFQSYKSELNPLTPTHQCNSRTRGICSYVKKPCKGKYKASQIWGSSEGLREKKW